jgi:hypothetical protein
MNGFKKCSNGHFYKEDLNACPYCPGASSGGSAPSGGDLGRTMVTEVASPLGGDSGKTEVFGGAGDGLHEKTTVVGGGNVSGGAAPSTAPKRDLNRTYIGGMNENDDHAEPGKVETTPRATRKIVGWIISYTLDNMGVDYRIYEGRNTIGRDASNSIPITKDTTISSEHVIILFRNGSFKIKDRMTANGTFLNGQEIEVEEAYDLNDGDEIRLGNTIFKFKSAL